MGTLGNGDGDLPELPPGWGPIRIPDDASELAEEAAQVRRELRERVRAPRPADGGGRVVAPSFRQRTVRLTTEPASLRLPLLIMSAALLAAVVSLFAVAWPGDRRQPATENTAEHHEHRRPHGARPRPDRRAGRPGRFACAPTGGGPARRTAVPAPTGRRRCWPRRRAGSA